MNYFRLAKQYWRALRDWRKRVQLRITLKNHDQKPSDQDFNPATVKKVALFLWYDKLGDTFVSTVFAQAIKTARPDIHVCCIVGHRSSPLLDGCAAIGHVWVVGKRSWKTARTLTPPNQPFDLVIDMGTSMSALDFTALKNLGANHYLGFEKQAIRLFDVNLSATDNHFVERYLAAAQIITRQPATAKYFSPRSDQSARLAASFQQNIPDQLPYFLLNLFGSGKYRRFNNASAKTLIDWLLINYPDFSVALLRVPGQDSFLNQLVNENDSERLMMTPAPSSIPLTFELIKKARVVLSPDTAVIHFCNASGGEKASTC